MVYKEEVRDLFSVPNDYYLAQCISADFGMGKGIAVEFNRRFDTKRKLSSKYNSCDVLTVWDYQQNKGLCLYVDRVFCLITKRNFWHKPTYNTMHNALLGLRDWATRLPVRKIAMPLIGCGLDRLRWEKVSDIIQKEFDDTDIEILVCKQ